MQFLRTKAQFVAMNEVAMMEINQEWLQGTQSKLVTSQGETWQIDKSAQSTISLNVQKIDLQVVCMIRIREKYKMALLIWSFLIIQ